MKRRVLVVAIAVVLAVIGTGSVLLYVNQANARAVAGMKAVHVLIANSLIPSGTSASAAQQEGLLRSENLPASSVPADALTSITPGLGSLVTSADVQAGQLLVRPMLVNASEAAGGLAVPHGMVAVSIELCTSEAVAANVHAGSLVAVYNTSSGASSSSTFNSTAACSGQHSQFGHSAFTKLMFARVEVLSVGVAAPVAPASASQTSTTSASQNGPQDVGQNNDPVLLTLAVSQPDAQRLILLTETGMPYLALLK